MDSKAELEKVAKLIAEAKELAAKRGEQILEQIPRMRQGKKWIEEGLFDN